MPPTVSGITESSDGQRVIPSSVRADGTTRKEIKVRPGYRPPEDVERYKNRSAQAWKEREKVVGKVPGAAVVSDDEANPSTPGNSKNAKKRASKRRAKEAAAAAAVVGEVADEEKDKQGAKEPVADTVTSAAAAATTTSARAPKTELLTEEEKEKAAKGIRKKLRQANELKNKKEGGESLLPEQLEKVIRIAELTRQLRAMGFEE